MYATCKITFVFLIRENVLLLLLYPIKLLWVFYSIDCMDKCTNCGFKYNSSVQTQLFIPKRCHINKISTFLIKISNTQYTFPLLAMARQ